MRILTCTFLVALAALLSAASCGDRNQVPAKPLSREQLIEANRQNVIRERERINAWVAQKGYTMRTTHTGLRYEVMGHGTGDSALTGTLATIAYDAYLLNGERTEGAPDRDPLRFRVGQADVVSGLHEALTLLRQGDTARLVLPSHLAYGVTGRLPDVPPNAPLYYEVRVLHVD